MIGQNFYCEIHGRSNFERILHPRSEADRKLCKEVTQQLIDRYRDVSIFELNEIFKSTTMENKGSTDPIDRKKIDIIIEVVAGLEDRTSGLRNRIHSAAERLNGCDENKHADDSDSPVSSGSMSDILDRLYRVSENVDAGHGYMSAIEAAV